MISDYMQSKPHKAQVLENIQELIGDMYTVTSKGECWMDDYFPEDESQDNGWMDDLDYAGYKYLINSK